MKKLFLTKAAAIMMTLIFIIGISGCGINAPGTKQYVESVKEDMLQAVNYTRKLKEQQKSLDARSIDSAKENLETLDTLDDVYTDLLRLESPSAYSELDDEIKENASSALSYIKELKSLVTTAMNSADDFLYKQDSPHIMEQYEKNYSSLVDLSSQVTTKYRND